jgi:hypothetical protein
MAQIAEETKHDNQADNARRDGIIAAAKDVSHVLIEKSKFRTQNSEFRIQNSK